MPSFLRPNLGKITDQHVALDVLDANSSPKCLANPGLRRVRQVRRVYFGKDPGGPGGERQLFPGAVIGVVSSPMSLRTSERSSGEPFSG